MNLPFAAGVGAALIGLHLLSGAVDRRRWPNRLLGTFFFLFAGQLFLQSLQLGSPERQLGPYRVALILAANPLVYLFFESLRAGTVFSIRWRDGAHWLPVLLVPVLMQLSYLSALDLLLLASMAAYGIVLGLSLRHGAAQFPGAGRAAFLWLQGFTLFYAIAALLDGAIALELLGHGDMRTSHLLPVAVLMVFALFLVLVYGAMGRRSIYDWLYRLAPSGAGPSLPDDELAALAERIRVAIGESRIHGDGDMSLTRFARRMGAPARHVSHAINRCLGVSFSDLLNAARVDAATRLLTDVEWVDRPVTDIAYEVGFHSKSNFHRAFKRITGTTPGDYRSTHAAAR